MAVVTLTSDIGNRDYIIGSVKGRLLRSLSNLQIVDISHEVLPFNLNEGAYFMRNACRHFPDFSWHIALVNVYYDDDPNFLVAFADNRYYICPNNGILPMILDRKPGDLIMLDMPANSAGDFYLWMDRIASLIQKVENGGPFHEMGEEPEEIYEHSNMKPTYGLDWIDGQIIFVDRFENVIVNITRDDFLRIGNGRPFEISIVTNEKITRLSKHYGDAAGGDKLAFFNSAGYLEIAVNKGNAAGLFGLQAMERSLAPALAKARNVYEKVRIMFLPD